MDFLKAVCVIYLLTQLSLTSTRAWSQEDGLEDELDQAEQTANAESGVETQKSKEDMSSDDAALDGAEEEKSTSASEVSDLTPEEKTVDEVNSSPNEMSLEPLSGDEDQVTEVPVDSNPKASSEPEPAAEDFSVPPPQIQETVVNTTPAPQTDDEPDLAYEAKLYDIYVNYNSKKLTQEEWTQLIGARESETYKIQSGDTLWSISKVFFNDGAYWPKIWQLNSSITNPHLIRPGHSIRFLLGTEGETPAFAITENSQENQNENQVLGGKDVQSSESANGLNKESQLAVNTSQNPTDEVEIPPSTEAYTPVLKTIPPSLPEWFLQRRGNEYDDTGIDYGRRRILDLPDKKYLESFIDEKNLVHDGEVSEIEGQNKTAANYQYVFVKLQAGQAKPGDIYTVIRSSGRVERATPEVALSSNEMGYRYSVQGQVRLEDLISTASDGKDVFRAFVTKTLSQIEVGSQIVRGSLPSVSVKSEGPKNDKMTQIIGAHELTSQKTLTLHSLAYLSSGKNDGFKEGQILTVRANTRIRNASTSVKESYIPVGLLKVVRVTDRFATAIVLKVWDAMFVGDVTGAGKVLPPEPPERRKGGQTIGSALGFSDDSASQAVDLSGSESNESSAVESDLDEGEDFDLE